MMNNEDRASEPIVTMELFCEDCVCNHRYELPELEWIIYALLGHASDLQLNDSEGKGDHTTLCLNTVRDWRYDLEAYAEFVDGGIESRNAFKGQYVPKELQGARPA